MMGKMIRTELLIRYVLYRSDERTNQRFLTAIDPSSLYRRIAFFSLQEEEGGMGWDDNELLGTRTYVFWIPSLGNQTVGFQGNKETRRKLQRKKKRKARHE